MSNVNMNVIERATELLRENPNLKFFEARDKARRELGEMDRGTIPGVPTKERGSSTRKTKKEKQI